MESITSYPCILKFLAILLERKEKISRLLASEKKGICCYSKEVVRWLCFSTESHRSYYVVLTWTQCTKVSKFLNELLKRVDHIAFSLALFIACRRNNAEAASR